MLSRQNNNCDGFVETQSVTITLDWIILLVIYLDLLCGAHLGRCSALMLLLFPIFDYWSNTMRPITDVIQDILKHLKRFLPTFSDIIMYAPLHQLVSVSVGPVGLVNPNVAGLLNVAWVWGGTMCPHLLDHPKTLWKTIFFYFLEVYNEIGKVAKCPSAQWSSRVHFMKYCLYIWTVHLTT